MYTLIETARLNYVDPAWLADVIARIATIRSIASTSSCLELVADPAQAKAA